MLYEVITRLRALTRIRVLVQRRAVEAPQRVRVRGEVPRHPVQQHADALLVQVVHQVPEVIRVAEARGGRVVVAHLVA